MTNREKLAMMKIFNWERSTLMSRIEIKFILLRINMSVKILYSFANGVDYLRVRILFYLQTFNLILN